MIPVARGLLFGLYVFEWTCTSHSDCNGDSICDKGTCTAKPPVWRAPPPSLRRLLRRGDDHDSINQKRLTTKHTKDTKKTKKQGFQPIHSTHKLTEYIYGTLLFANKRYSKDLFR